MSWFGSMFQCFRCLFQMTFPDDCFGSLFQMTINCCDIHFTYILLHMANLLNRWLFRMRVSDDCSEWLFRMPISADFSRWLVWITVPDEHFGCLFVIPRLILISPTNSYFHIRFLFQPIIRLIGPTTDSFWNDGFLLQNYGPDPPWYFLQNTSGGCFCLKYDCPYNLPSLASLLMLKISCFFYFNRKREISW